MNLPIVREPLWKGSFVSRPNRFVVICEVEGERVRAHLPNPGRLQELLVPGAEVWLEPSNDPRRATAASVVAVVRNGGAVPLHTSRANRVAESLIEAERVPGLEGWRMARREVVVGGSRFDFLLERNGDPLLVEVKSCTLFGGPVAMFPDAVTARGRRHVLELAELAGLGHPSAVLFMIPNGEIRFFSPEYHTDLAFAEACLVARRKVRWIPLVVDWDHDLRRVESTRLAVIPWGRIQREAVDRGAYLLVLSLPSSTTLAVGSLGAVRFGAGFYTYVGSGRSGLSRRIGRHRRRWKRPHWHVDRLRAVAEVRAALPIRTADDLECRLARALADLADDQVPGFGSSDCRCGSHLFYTRRDPLAQVAFHSLLQHFRMERLVRLPPARTDS